MSISGLVLQTTPERMQDVRQSLERLAAVEIHAATEDGRLVITVDEADDEQAAQIIAEFSNIAGVLSTSLAYNHFEDELTDEDPVQ
jgi:nitrate reductase NapD